MAAKSAPKKNLSAIKKARQDEKRRLRGQSVRASIKTQTKKAESVLSGKNKEEIGKALKEAVSTISTAASKGIIHKNTASRKISKLAKKANAAQKKD
ncbi:MAG: 30S ribosomal protein S20 [Dissulfurispiraceae bacterium]